MQFSISVSVFLTQHSLWLQLELPFQEFRESRGMRGWGVLGPESESDDILQPAKTHNYKGTLL